jgi:signal transduction histidine kinase
MSAKVIDPSNSRAGMPSSAPPLHVSPAPRQRGRLAWRIAVPLLAAVPLALLISIDSATPLSIWMIRSWMVAFAAAAAYAVCERLPARVPPWLARWVYQLLGIVVAIPLAAYAAYWATTGEFTFWTDVRRLLGYTQLTFAGVLFAPWFALAAMVRARDLLAHEQALAFALERGQLERQALDARLRLLQAQVQPHFLFNTLANVRALVGAGSPQAPAVLDSLIAYLRAAVPRLDEPAATVGDELKLVRAYLELMQLRMPDRLQYSVQADEAVLSVRCLPLSLLSLVENAVRHGIDPAEQGGRIEVSAQVRDGRCLLCVTDSGVGLTEGSGSGGTGLTNLRERLRLAWGEAAQLRLSEVAPRGVCAEIDYPVSPDQK